MFIIIYFFKCHNKFSLLRLKGSSFKKGTNLNTEKKKRYKVRIKYHNRFTSSKNRSIYRKTKKKIKWNTKSWLYIAHHIRYIEPHKWFEIVSASPWQKRCVTVINHSSRATRLNESIADTRLHRRREKMSLDNGDLKVSIFFLHIMKRYLARSRCYDNGDDEFWLLSYM